MNNVLLNQVVEALPDAVAVFDREMQLLVCNQTFAAEHKKYLGMGIKPGDSLPHALEACAPELLLQSRYNWERALNGERCTYVIAMGNPPVHFEINVSPISTDAVIMVCRNIEPELAARENERFFRNVLENLPVGLQMFTPDGASKDMNEAQRHILGDTHPAVNHIDYNVYRDTLSQRTGLPALLDEVKKQKGPVKREILLNYREVEENGVTRILPMYYETTGFPVLDMDGEVAYLFLILSEITEKKLTQISLEKSERLLYNIVENLPIGYIQFDNFGFIRRVNQTQRRFFAQSGIEDQPSEYNMIHDPFTKLFELDQLFIEVSQNSKMLRKEKKLSFEVNVAGGKLSRDMFLDLTMFPVEDPVDKDQFVVALVNDITEKKRQENETMKAQEFLQQTGEIGKIGGWEFDMQSGHLRFSPQTYKIHELPPFAVMTLRKALSFYSAESRKKLIPAFNACRDRGKAFDIQLSLLTARNNQLQVRAIGKPEYRNGQIVRLYGVIQDITEQYKIRDQLTRNTELMRLFFDTIDMGYAVMDKSGKVNFINRKAQEIVDHGKVIGQNIFEVFPMLKGSIFDARVEQCIQQQAPVSFSYYLRATDKWYEFLLAPMQDGSISIFTRNITESKKMQRELQKANDKLASLNKYLVNQNKQLEDFAHITSHNLRAPIANLKALMQIMNETDSEQEKELYSGMFQEVLRNIDETLNDLIEIVQIRKDLNVERERLSFEDRLQKIKDILFVDIETSGIQVTTDFHEAPYIVYPRIYLDSMLQNLLTNAIKYRRHGILPTLHFQTRYENGCVVLTAEDNGIGIDMDRYGTKLFGFRKTFHKNKDAKGIGLYITRSQVEAMGGSIQAESQIGTGTKFIITFSPE